MTRRFAGSICIREKDGMLFAYLLVPGAQTSGYLLGTMIVPPDAEHIARFHKLMTAIACDLIKEATGKSATATKVDLPEGNA